MPSAGGARKCRCPRTPRACLTTDPSSFTRLPEAWKEPAKQCIGPVIVNPPILIWAWRLRPRTYDKSTSNRPTHQNHNKTTAEWFYQGLRGKSNNLKSKGRVPDGLSSMKSYGGGLSKNKSRNVKDTFTIKIARWHDSPHEP